MQYAENFNLKKPEDYDMYNVLDMNENMDIIDTELNKRPLQDGNAGEMTAEFEQASSRNNLASGESLKLLFGKIMKWLTDLKTGAFASVANNDTTTTGGYVADARMVKAHGDEIDELNTNLVTHKSGMDHDGRYYTEAEVDGKITELNTDIRNQIGQLNTDLIYDNKDITINTAVLSSYQSVSARRSVNTVTLKIYGALAAHEQNKEYKVAAVTNALKPKETIYLTASMLSGTNTTSGTCMVSIKTNGDVMITPQQSDCNWIYAFVTFVI